MGALLFFFKDDFNTRRFKMSKVVVKVFKAGYNF